MPLTPEESEQLAAKMIAYKLFSRCRRELVSQLENVTDPVPVIANYFDREMDKLNFELRGREVKYADRMQEQFAKRNGRAK